MLEGLSLGGYSLLVDFTGRLFRDGKAAISTELAGIRFDESLDEADQELEEVEV